MKPATSTAQVADTGKTAPEQAQGNPPASEAEKELVWSLKRHIDKNGRYTYELDRYALAFAAGRGGNTSAYQAKQEIEKSFTREVGVTMHQTLEKYRQERGLEIKPMRSRR